MSAPAEPNWTLLPHEPQQFFELPDHFDRVDLRRKYSALIRRFKPEKHPDEFQRIRAAFEVLDQQLRASQRQPSHLRPIPSTHRPSDADRPETQSPSEPTSTKPPERPTRRVIEIRRPEPPEQLAQSLRGLAHRLRNDQFYAEAWSIWEELTAVEPFERWQPLLTELSEIVDIDDYDQPPVEKVEFFIRFLRRALWAASDDWCEDAFDFLEDNADLVREPWEYELLLRLDDYRDDRKAFLDGTRGRQIIDDAILDYCMKSEIEALEAFRRHQMDLAAHPEWLREAFPFDNNDMSSHWPLWSWLSNEAGHRLRLPRRMAASEPASLQPLFDEAANLIRQSIEHTHRQEAEFTRSLDAKFNNLIGGSLMIGIFGVLCALPITAFLFSQFHSLEVCILFSTLVGVVVFVKAFQRGSSVLQADAQRVVTTASDWKAERAIALSCYENVLESRLKDFMRRTGLTFDELVELSWSEIMSTSFTLKQSLLFAQLIHQAISTDYALASFAVAIRFLR